MVTRPVEAAKSARQESAMISNDQVHKGIYQPHMIAEKLYIADDGIGCPVRGLCARFDHYMFGSQENQHVGAFRDRLSDI